jgi:protein-S-isoprenylcysteine O-methyltransferase
MQPLFLFGIALLATNVRIISSSTNPGLILVTLVWLCWNILTVLFARGDFFEYAFIASVSSFHFGEYVLARRFRPESATFDSFLLNNSGQYTVCLILAILEHSLSSVDWGIPHSLRYLGITCSYFGLLIRFSAICKAKRGFTHLVATKKKSTHFLVTSGIYSVCRHPSYSGWFIWILGTQLILGNVLCPVLFTCISWTFFRGRITYEEFHLVSFFRESYVLYKDCVWSGIPGID